MNKDVKDADRIEDLAGALVSGNTDKETVEWLIVKALQQVGK